MIVLTAADVERLLVLEDLIPALESAHLEHATGGITAPTPLQMPSASTDTHFLAMAASSARLQRSVVKTLNDTPSNTTRGLDTQRSTVLVLDDVDGRPAALIEGVLLTKMRTAAASAVATSWLSRPDSTSLALLGAGALAPLHARAISAVRPIDEVIVWNRTHARAHALVTLLREQGVRARVAQSAEEATKSAEIVCTLTPAAAPILRGEWLAAGQHLNVVGAPPRVDHREVDGVAMARADVVVDSVANTLAKSGDALLALAEGAITHADLDVELGQVIAGTKSGRRNSEAITLFNSLGMGLQDLAAADIVYRAATAAASLALRS